MIRNYPKLLVISHNLFDRTNNVGKTLQSLLSTWPKDKLFSLYFRNEKPSVFYCEDYYLLHDKDVLKTLASCGIYQSGITFNERSIKSIACSETEKGMYRLGNQRKPFISRARDMMWHVSPWRNKKLNEWLKRIDPEIILFVPNDYELAFEVLHHVKRRTNAGVVTYYMDDVFYFNQDTSGFDRIRRNRLLKLGHAVADVSGCLFTTCDLMSREYEALFHKKCFPFGNCIEVSEGEKQRHEGPRISYIGNLHSNRWKSLLEIGSALDAINIKNKTNIKLDIYSASDISEDIKKQLYDNAGIIFRGSLTPLQVMEKQKESDILVHVEAMDKKSKASTRLSVSTKIFEYLSVGRAIFAFGPADIASMQYLESTGAAIICNSKEELVNAIEELVLSQELQILLGKQGIEYAKKHCNATVESRRFADHLIKYGVRK